MTDVGEQISKKTPAAFSVVSLLMSAFSLLLPLCGFPSPAFAEDYSFDLSEVDKKPYHLGGYAEIRPILYGLDRDAALYQLRFYNRDEDHTLPEYNAAIQLEGGIEKGITKLFVRTNTAYQDSYLGATSTTTVYEAFLSVKPSPSFTIDAGKKTLKWGKGYAWNPVAFVDRPKNPDDPDLNLEGFVVVSADYIRSFRGPLLKTLSVTPVLVPVSEHVNDDLGTTTHLNTAGKIYLLLYDTDIDFLFLTGASRPRRYGMDLSRNITTNLEVHGEFARINDFTRSFIAADGTTHQTIYEATNWLLGLRYLTEQDTTYIFEYYRNGTGFTEQETRDYLTFVHNAYDSYRSTGNEALLRKATAVTDKNYGRPNAGQAYLYLRVSQKDPFDILYWTPAVTAIVNAEDRSYSLSPEISYTGITNLELRLRAMALAGDRLSEYGEKPYDYRVEMRARYYF
ncbi:MAG: hypothetical protein AABZ15_10190 [Nitrospirota bacterium]